VIPRQREGIKVWYHHHKEHRTLMTLSGLKIRCFSLFSQLNDS
jgi:hypothetical protein